MAKLSDLNILDIGNTINLAGALYSGNGKTYLCFFPEDKDDLSHEILEMSKDDWATFLRQTDLLETEVLTKASDGVLAKAILRKSQRQIEQGVSWNVFRRDGYTCVYCGRNDVPLTVDHLILWEEGGPSTEDNLLSSCRKCNKIRGNTDYKEWVTKHDYYKNVSRNLSKERAQANQDLIPKLESIPRLLHKRSR